MCLSGLNLARGFESLRLRYWAPQTPAEEQGMIRYRADEPDKWEGGWNMEVTDRMNEQEMKRVAIEKFVNIQRIKKHGQEEIDYQERIARTELQMLGIATEDLQIEK